ncbi:MAG: hypothetical protein FJ134_04485 [Deltaproteobacteria bacterium]|nr:hypothetical protein [Deltaproteobacteria bacterium]
MVSKYDCLKILKMTKAIKFHFCSNCDKEIIPGEYYYKENIKDKYIHALNLKNYCTSCFDKLKLYFI